jgi:hypothetical protein
MNDQADDDRCDSPIDGAPTWVRVLQAVLIGLVAGLALHTLLSMVVLQGSERVTAPRECRESAPVKAVSGARPAA